MQLLIFPCCYQHIKGGDQPANSRGLNPGLEMWSPGLSCLSISESREVGHLTLNGASMASGLRVLQIIGHGADSFQQPRSSWCPPVTASSTHAWVPEGSLGKQFTT